MYKKLLVLALVLLIVPAQASASVFDDIYNKLAYHPPQSAQPAQPVKQPETPETPETPALPIQAVQGQAQEKDSFGTFLYNLMALNTKENIEQLTSEMQSRNVYAVRIHVTNYDKNFYIVSGKGITGFSQTYDISYDLSKNQVMKLYDIARDGKVTFAESIKIQLILAGIL